MLTWWYQATMLDILNFLFELRTATASLPGPLVVACVCAGKSCRWARPQSSNIYHESDGHWAKLGGLRGRGRRLQLQQDGKTCGDRG